MSVYTIATLLLKEDEVLELTQKFVDTVGGDIWSHAHVPRARMGGPWDYLGGGGGMAYRVLLEDTFGPYLTDSRFHTHLSIFKNVEATPQEKARFKASNMYITLSPIILEMVTLREKKVPGEALKQPLKVVPIGKELPTAIKKCDEKQGEKEDELCVL